MTHFPFASCDNICSFTGPRPEKIFEKIDDIKISLEYAIIDAIEQGYTHFICGMSRGFDLLAADVVLNLSEKYNIYLIAAIPFINQEHHWCDDDQYNYNKILCKSRYTFCISKTFHRGAYHERNRFMIDNSTKVITYYNNSSGGTKYTLDYAKKHDRKIVNIYNRQITF